MPDEFDPYYKWLGIRADERPINHYRLLGIAQFEDDADVISNAADQRMAWLKSFQTGVRGALSQRLLNEVAKARICLLRTTDKEQYDQTLHSADNRMAGIGRDDAANQTTSPQPHDVAPGHAVPIPAVASDDSPLPDLSHVGSPSSSASRLAAVRRKTRETAAWLAMLAVLVAASVVAAINLSPTRRGIGEPVLVPTGAAVEVAAGRTNKAAHPRLDVDPAELAEPERSSEGENIDTANRRIREIQRTAPQAVKIGRGDVVATYLICTCDYFVVDIYHNGNQVPLDRRRLLGEHFGAQVEKDDLDIREGDWIVFNVVSNQLRWGGAQFFAVAGINAADDLAFESNLKDGLWFSCDEVAVVPEFISDPMFLSERKVRAATGWSDGDRLMRGHVAKWSGEPVWGTSRSTWIKFVVPRKPRVTAEQ